MEVIRGIRNLKRALERPVVMIGNFDGVHLGHQKILSVAKEQARSRSGTLVAYTFRPHPRVALRPEAEIPLLLTYDEKLELLGQMGVDVVIDEPFSREFSTTTAERFFSDVILTQLNAVSIVVGYDFAFGKEREGHLDALASLCERAAVNLTVVEPQRLGDEVVSSSRIRKHLLAGDVAAAARLLGREFFYRGVVIKGEARGRKIGFPTANLRLENKIALPNGVYATWAVLGDRRFNSVTNVGTRPTFVEATGSELPVLIETHLLDQSLDLYGNTLEVRFVDRLRDERKFDSVEALTAQIAQDVIAARRILTSS